MPTSKFIWAPLALGAVMLMPAGADAFWGSHGSYGSASSGSYASRGSYASSGSYSSHGSYARTGGSSGSYGSYASSGSSSSYGSHGPGPLRRLAMRIHARHASSASSGSSASHGSSSSSSYSSHGSSSSTGSYSSHGSYSTHGSYSSHGSYASTSVTKVYASKPVVSSSVVASSKSGKGMLRVSVPADATVWVNDVKTKSTGSDRQYVSNGLVAGQSYTYRVKVEFKQDGKTVTQHRTATLTAGDEVALAFAAPNQPSPAVAEDQDEASTKLTLNVPADAKVTLAGAVTSQTGAVREFVTTRLPAGQTWEDYTVRVEFEQDGQPRTLERTITLRGGESQSLAFGLDAPTLASR